MNTNHKIAIGKNQRKFHLSIAVTVVLAMAADPSFASPNPSGGPMPYASLAAEWWQWAWGTPTAVNPLLDTTGEFFGVNQKGKYWFLAGSYVGPVDRTCTVPAGKSLFFPVVNTAYAAFLIDVPPKTDPSLTKAIPFLRNNVGDIADCTRGSATVDGNPVPIVREHSRPFVIQLPVDNFFGAKPADIKNLMLAPVVDAGDYVLLKPLSPGDHIIVIRNIPNGTCLTDQDVTYHLTIEP